jgi:hypothetical protein
MAIATLAGDATMFVCGGISHMVLLKGMEFTSMSSEEPIVATFPSLPSRLMGTPALRQMVCIASRASISEGAQPKKNSPHGKRGFARASPE